MSKKAQVEEWLPHGVYYLVLALVGILIVVLLFRGQIQDVWQKIVDLVSFS